MNIMILFYKNVRNKQMSSFFIKARTKDFECVPCIEKDNIINDGLIDLINEKSNESIIYIKNNIYNPLKEYKYQHDIANKLHLKKYRSYLFSKPIKPSKRPNDNETAVESNKFLKRNSEEQISKTTTTVNDKQVFPISQVTKDSTNPGEKNETKELDEDLTQFR